MRYWQRKKAACPCADIINRLTRKTKKWTKHASQPWGNSLSRLQQQHFLSVPYKLNQLHKKTEDLLQLSSVLRCSQKKWKKKERQIIIIRSIQQLAAEWGTSKNFTQFFIYFSFKFLFSQCVMRDLVGDTHSKCLNLFYIFGCIQWVGFFKVDAHFPAL